MLYLFTSDKEPIRVGWMSIQYVHSFMAVRSLLLMVCQVNARQPSGWASIAIGNAMAGGHSYVAWSPGGAPDGPWRLDAYRMASLGGQPRWTSPPPHTHTRHYTHTPLPSCI